MIQEDFITINQNNPLNNDILDEETVIRSVFTPCYRKLESWNSEKSNDIYFIKESSKFSENDPKESIFNRKDSFNIMQNFDDVYDLMGFNEDMNNLHIEKEEDRLVSEENENENIPHFEKVDIMFANAGNEINDDGGVVINIIDPQKFAEKIKEKVKSLETPFPKVETVISVKKKTKRGKRGPYKKKPKTIIKTKINGKCFPFTAGKGILTEEINDNKIKQYMENTPFRTNKYITDKEGNKKREKKQRKYKPDDIRKKIKVRFHKKIKNILNENLKNAGANELFSFLPQFFIGNISKKFNYQYMNTTFEELLSINFSDFQKEYFNKECDKKQFDKNKKTLEYLKNNPEISKISGFDKMKKMKYRDLLCAYFSSLEFEHSVGQLEKEKESAEYIQEYIYLAKSYIEYFTSSDGNL
jgi:hypothetical protein